MPRSWWLTWRTCSRSRAIRADPRPSQISSADVAAKTSSAVESAPPDTISTTGARSSSLPGAALTPAPRQLAPVPRPLAPAPPPDPWPARAPAPFPYAPAPAPYLFATLGIAASSRTPSLPVYLPVYLHVFQSIHGNVPLFTRHGMPHRHLTSNPIQTQSGIGYP